MEHVPEGLLPASHVEEVARLRALARERLAPVCLGDHQGVNRVLVSALAAEGLLRRVFPASGVVSATELCLLREALAAEATAAETALALQGLGAYPILMAGSPAIVSEWIPKVTRGDAVPAFALSEPGAGSDAGGLKLRARPVPGGFVLDGHKKWISNAPEADVYSVFARTGHGRQSAITAFAVPAPTKGLTGGSLRLVAPHVVGQLQFDGVFVPDENVLGGVGRGFEVAMQTLDLFRPSVGAAAVGMATAALECATAHARSRQAFGGPIARFQAVSHRLADMATQIQAARLMVFHAAAMFDQGAAATTKLAAMAKLFATESAQQVVDAAVQIHGASGLEHGHLLELLYREVRAPRIYEGTSEIQREIIARRLLA